MKQPDKTRGPGRLVCPAADLLCDFVYNTMLEEALRHAIFMTAA